MPGFVGIQVGWMLFLVFAALFGSGSTTAAFICVNESQLVYTYTGEVSVGGTTAQCLENLQDSLLFPGIMTKEFATNLKKNYRDSLEGDTTVAKNLANKSNNELWFDWEPYLDNLWWDKVDTTFNSKSMKKIGTNLCNVPAGFNLGNQAKKIFAEREQMLKGEIPINWGFAEMM